MYRNESPIDSDHSRRRFTSICEWKQGCRLIRVELYSKSNLSITAVSHIPFQQQRTIVGPLMDQLASCSSQCVIHAESACYNHTSLSEFLFPTRRHTMQRAQKNSTFSHSPCLISLSIYKHLTLLWAVSGVFWLPQDSSLIPFPWTYSIGSKSKIITKIRIGFSTFSKRPAQRVCLQNQNEKVCPNLHSSSIKDMRTKKPITSISGHGNIYNYIFIKCLYYSIYTLFNKLSRERKAKSEALLHITSQIVHFLLKGRKGGGGGNTMEGIGTHNPMSRPKAKARQHILH